MTAAKLSAIRKGEVVEQFDERLLEIIQDVIDRPGVSGDRVAMLKIKIRPKLDPLNGANFPEIVAEVSSHLPGTKMEDYGIIKDGTMVVTRAVQAELTFEEEELPFEEDEPENIVPITKNGGE